MPLKTVVKVGGITSLSEARYCAGMGVDLLGFGAINGKANYLSPARFQEIRGWIAGPKIVAEIYGIENQGQLEAILTDYKPDYLELGESELNVLGDLPLPFLLSIPAGSSLPPLSRQPDYLLLKELTTDPYPYPCLVEVHSYEEVERASSASYVSGIAMTGSPEIRPGLKEYDALADILEQLEVE